MFIVHADDDAPFVRGELLPMLNLGGDRVILSSELPFPAFTEQAIESAVRRSRLTIAVISPAYLRDRWAGFAELLSRNIDEDGRGGSLVPLVIADCAVPAILAQHAALDGRTPSQREAAAARLRERLGRPAPHAAPIDCPYPGLRPFSAAMSSRFRGREHEIETVLARLHAGEREIYVFGPSGSGKSSLIAAGVVPRLQREHAGDRFVVRSLRPGEQPAQRLADALGCEPATLDGAPGRLLEREHGDRLLVFIDQLEELFTLSSAGERDRFVPALRGLRADRRCHVIAALRADFYGALMSSELWADIEGRFARLDIAPLRGEALRRAIEAPALEAGVYLERGLVERLMSDAAAEPGALPLLQEALVLLWARRSHRLLRLASYEALDGEAPSHDGGGEPRRTERRSGLAVALARRADAVLHDLTAAQQLVAQRIFLRLVSFGEGRPDTRRQQSRAALAACGDDTAGADPVIDRLIDGRLLTSTATARGQPLVDLAHEALIAGWPALQHWLLSRRDDEQRRRLLELHAAQWVERGRGRVGLFDAIELAEAERWIAGDTARELAYSDDLPQFLAASRDALAEAERERQIAAEQRKREREQRRRLTRIAMVALVLLATIASSVGVIAWQQREEAVDQRRETHRHLALNLTEIARSSMVERGDALGAIPRLLAAARLGMDTTVLRTLFASAGTGLWRIRLVHGGRVELATHGPDGTRVVTASADHTARVWDAATGHPLGAPLEHDDVVISGAFSPDGTRVVTASADHTARMWDATTGRPLGRPLEHGSAVISAAFSPDGTRVVTASADHTARVWDAATGRPLGMPLEHAEAVSSAAFSPAGTRVLTSSDDGVVRVWDATTGSSLGVSFKHDQAITSASFSSDGTRVLTSSDDGTARVWDAAAGSPIGLSLKHDQAITSAVFSLDGTRVVTASADGRARVWDAATGNPIGVLLKHDRAVRSAAFSPDGTRVVTASDDHTARVWDATTGNPLGVPLRHEDAVKRAAFSPDGASVVTASSDGSARVWDVVTAKPLGVSLQHVEMVRAAAFSPDGARVVTASVDRAARIWDATTGIPTGISFHHTKAVTSAAFSPDGRRVVTASADGSARIWDAETGNPIGVPLKLGRLVTSATFSPDGTWVAIASADGSARVRRAETGGPGLVLEHEQAVTSISFSPDGESVVTASSDGSARVWSVTTGSVIGGSLKHAQTLWGAAFSPDGKRVVTACADGSARVWEAATGRLLAGPFRHDQAVRSAAFSPDGGRVVTASADGTARIWDAMTGSLLAISFHEEGVWSAAFSPDGTRLVSASGTSVDVSEIVETGPLGVWAARVAPCLLLPDGAPGPSRVCPLAVRSTTTADRVARARAFMAEGDRHLYTRVWCISKARYLQALSSLDPDDGSPTHDVESLRRAISARLAILAAIEGRMADARDLLGPASPRTDAGRLGVLGIVAHEDAHHDGIAVELFRRAQELAPGDPSTLAGLAEAHFAAGDLEAFARVAGQIDERRASLGMRIALAALAWASAVLRHAATDADAERLLRVYRDLATGQRVSWVWSGTKHALTYGGHRYKEVEPILDVLALLQRPASDFTRARLAELLAGASRARRAR